MKHSRSCPSLPSLMLTTLVQEDSILSRKGSLVPEHLRLNTLPLDILIVLSEHLYSLEDLYALIRTCRALYLAYGASKVKLRPVFPRGRHASPRPLLLFAGVARQIADHCISKPNGDMAMQELLKLGLGKMLAQGTRFVTLGLNDLRKLHETEIEVLRPLAIRIAQRQQIITEEQKIKREERKLFLTGLGLASTKWDTFVTTAYQPPPDEMHIQRWISTLCEYLTYCELFHHTFEHVSNPQDTPKTFDKQTRITWASYCYDDYCWETIGARRREGGNCIWQRSCDMQNVWSALRPIRIRYRAGRKDFDKGIESVIMHQGLTTLKHVVQEISVADDRVRASNEGFWDRSIGVNVKKGSCEAWLSEFRSTDNLADTAPEDRVPRITDDLGTPGIAQGY